jgi:hypothetical protein
MRVGGNVVPGRCAGILARRQAGQRPPSSGVAHLPTPVCVASQASSWCERAHGGVNEDHRMARTAPGERGVDRPAAWSGPAQRGPAQVWRDGR